MKTAKKYMEAIRNKWAHHWYKSNYDQLSAFRKRMVDEKIKEIGKQLFEN